MIKRLYRPRRQHRYAVMVDEGFTKREARELSRVTFYTPWARKMRRDRERLQKRAKVEKLKVGEFRLLIAETYDIQGWDNAWDMLRWYKEKFGQDYESPWEKKKRPKDHLDYEHIRARY